MDLDPVGLWILLVVCGLGGVVAEAVRRQRRGDARTVGVLFDVVLTGLGIGLSLALVLFIGALLFIRAGF